MVHCDAVGAAGPGGPRNARAIPGRLEGKKEKGPQSKVIAGLSVVIFG